MQNKRNIITASGALVAFFSLLLLTSCVNLRDKSVTDDVFGKIETALENEYVKQYEMEIVSALTYKSTVGTEDSINVTKLRKSGSRRNAGPSFL